MSNITTDQIGELIAQGKSGRVTRELLQAFLRNPQSVNGKPADYPVTIDYENALEEMISDGKYDGKYDGENRDINADNFPVAGEGTVETKLQLVHLNKVTSTDEVEAYLEVAGLRPATIEELLAFGAKYPDVQREFPIIALGSHWVDPSGRRRVPCLFGDDFERGLFLGWGDDVCGKTWRFLAVRKE